MVGDVGSRARQVPPPPPEAPPPALPQKPQPSLRQAEQSTTAAAVPPTQVLPGPGTTAGECDSARAKAEPSAASAVATATMDQSRRRRRPMRSMACMPTSVPQALVAAGASDSSRAARLGRPASCRMDGV